MSKVGQTGWTNTLGILKVREITPGHVVRMLEGIKSRGYERRDQRIDFSEDSLRLIRSTLSVIMSDAIEDGIITLNPCSGINQGRRTRAGRSFRKKRRKRVRPFNAQEREAFLEAIQGQWLGPLFETMLRCGLRPGEAYALTPNDVDLESGRIHVHGHGGRAA